MASLLMVAMGLSDWKSRREISEPVTTTSSTVEDAALVVVAPGDVCEWATPANASANAEAVPSNG